MKKKILKTNKEKILSFAGRGGFDEEAIKDIKRGWKRWNDKINKKCLS